MLDLVKAATAGLLLWYLPKFFTWYMDWATPARLQLEVEHLGRSLRGDTEEELAPLTQLLDENDPDKIWAWREAKEKDGNG